MDWWSLAALVPVAPAPVQGTGRLLGLHYGWLADGAASVPGGANGLASSRRIAGVRPVRWQGGRLRGTLIQRDWQ
jgi:hypothetical protein